MTRPLFLLMAALAAPLALANTPPRPPKPAQLGLCVACHGENGQSRTPGTPHIGGQDRLYLELSLRAYREGTRRSNPMNGIANALQPRDIQQLAAWYAAQPGFRAAPAAR
jgi:cytochrome c553